MRYLIILTIALAFGVQAFAGDEKSSTAATTERTTASAPKVEKKKKVEYRKTQEVNFDGSDIDGQVRTPDGAYLLQKRGVQFMPLYKVNNQFEKNILESVEYLR